MNLGETLTTVIREAVRVNQPMLGPAGMVWDVGTPRVGPHLKGRDGGLEGGE